MRQHRRIGVGTPGRWQFHRADSHVDATVDGLLVWTVDAAAPVVRPRYVHMSGLVRRTRAGVTNG